MERHVKERLVGAAVLVAAAVILIPELLSGPKHTPAAAAPVRAGEAPIKTYTIDLNRSPDVSAAVEESAPPPESSESLAANESPAPTAPQDTTRDARPSASSDTSVAASSAESAASSPPPVVSDPAPVTPAQAKPESAPGKAPAPRADVPRPAPADEVKKLPPKVEPPKSAEPPRGNALALASTVPNSKAATTKQWAVQLGSFASKANAERLVKDWEGRSQHGMTTPIKAANGTLYRVRLGPFADRAMAEEVLRKVKPTISGAAVVAHP